MATCRRRLQLEKSRGRGLIIIIVNISLQRVPVYSARESKNPVPQRTCHPWLLSLQYYTYSLLLALEAVDAFHEPDCLYLCYLLLNSYMTARCTV